MAISGNQNVQGVFPFWDDTNAKAWRDFSRHVLHAMDSQVDVLFQQGCFDFLDKETFAPHLSEGYVQDLVPRGLDLDDFNLALGVHP
jgi:hypothetical protein